MIDLEAPIKARHPEWLQGRRGQIVRRLVQGFRRVSRLDRIESFVEAEQHLSGFALIERTLAWIGCRYRVDQNELQRIPTSGALLIVANHPLGALDALALLHLVGRVRRDVRIVANEVLMSIEGMRPLLLPLRVFGGGVRTARPLRVMEQALADGEAVIVFPAGEVSRLGWRGVRDRPWQPGVARLIERSGAPVLPVHVQARNSAFFYSVASLLPTLGTMLLPREMTHAREAKPIELRVGLPVAAAALRRGAPDRTAVVARLRQLVDDAGQGKSSPEGFMPIAARVDPLRLRTEIMKLPRLGETAEGREILLARFDADSIVLAVVARLRELTFRAVGEGSGAASDTDAFDTWYDHILLWDPRDLEIVGAYRVVTGTRALAHDGVRGFYTHTLFEFDARILPLLERSLELGRSFVQPRYWGSRSLDELWCGIGAYLRAHPGIRYLFGPVSISASLPLAARSQVVSYYDRFHGDPQGSDWVRARQPFLDRAGTDFNDMDADAGFALLRRNLDALGARLPMLYKQYTELCEPGGVRFLGFNVDSDFADAVDGLVLVDLARMRPQKRRRYLEPRAPRGRASAQSGSGSGPDRVQEAASA